MFLSLTYDAGIGAWTMSHTDANLETEADVAAWRQLVHTELKKLGDKPVYLLVDVTNFHVAATRMEDYGRTVKSIGHHFIAVFRYGAGGRTQTAVLLQSVLNRFQPNLYPDRESAVRALKQHRDHPDARPEKSRAR
jgi:hypothetical protein